MSARISYHQYSDLCFTGLSRLSHASTPEAMAEAEALVIAHLDLVQTDWEAMDADDIDDALEGLMVQLIRFLRSKRIPVQ